MYSPVVARLARVLALSLLAGLLSGCGAKHHRSVPAAPRTQPGYSVGQVRAAFAREGLSLTVLARDHGIVLLYGTPSLSPVPPTFADSINVQIRPRVRDHGRILVVVPSGHRLLWARNVVVDFNPASQSAVKTRAAVAHLKKTP